MKKLFYLLLCVPLVFASCDKLFPEENEPAKNMVLTLTSEATLNFEAEGGEAVITFDLKEETRSAAPLMVEVTCEADWVEATLVEAENKVNVAAKANDAETSRETKVVVSYGTQKFEVAVNQAAKVAAPSYAMDVKLAAAERIPSEELGLGVNDYALAFIDDAENVELGFILTGDAVLNAGEYKAEEAELYTYEPEKEYSFVDGDVTVAVDGENYSFDITLKDADEALYHFTYEGVVIGMEYEGPQVEPETFTPVKVIAEYWNQGNFMLKIYVDETIYHELDMYDFVGNNSNFLAAGTYTCENEMQQVGGWSVYGLPNDQTSPIVEAEVTLSRSEDGQTTIVGYIKSEDGHFASFNWTGVVEGFNLAGGTTKEDIIFAASFFGGEFLSAEDAYAPANNYFFVLSDTVADGGTPAPNSTFFYFDLWSNETNDTNTVPNGVYEYDMTDSCEHGTAGAFYTYGFVTNDSGVPTWYIYNEGTVTVTDGKIEAIFILEDGRTATITYEGDLSLGSTSGGDNNDPNTSYSTLTSDIEFNETGFSCVNEYYADWYSSDTDNWWVTLYEDGESKSGKYFQLDLLADFYADNWGLEYKPWSVGNLVNTYIPGDISDNGLTGCWYAELTNGNVTGQMAPIFDGTINVSFNDDGSKTFTFDCVDDAGHKITGTVTTAPTASTLSAKANSGKKVTITLPTMKSRVIR
ncbi:MAG: BACON domain-containing protein [Alistipes sp.]|nr:BACON domain-containing protein [Alistipes sp.]